MKIDDPSPSELPTSLILTTSVILTVLIALFLAFSDDLQTRLPSLIRPTAVAEGAIEALTTLPAASATPVPTNSVGPPTGLTVTPTTPVSLIAEATCNNAPANWEEVVVGPSDTLYTLSIQYGATIGEIVQANCLETTAVFSGMTLYLPQTFPTRLPCGPPQWWTTYIVRPGETLFILARRHGTTVYAIKQANCMVDSRIFAGRSLFLPPLPATVPPPPTLVFPTNTPIPTVTPTATGLPSPTASATSPVTPSPTTTMQAGTPTPTGSPAPSDTPGPTTTATVTLPPSPTATLSATPEATNTAVPTNTPTPPPPDTPTSPPPTQTNPPPPSATSPPSPSATPQPTENPPINEE